MGKVQIIKVTIVEIKVEGNLIVTVDSILVIKRK
jgi:hypothetical protein